MEKFLKLIIVVVIIGFVLAFFLRADINRYLRNTFPDYTTPEHEEVESEEIEGLCGEGWTMIARSVLGGTISFCGDAICSVVNLRSSEISAKDNGKDKTLYIDHNGKWLYGVTEIGEVKEDGVFIISSDIFLGKGGYSKVKDKLPSYNDSINLDGAKLIGEFICREGEKLKMMEYDKVAIDSAGDKCEVNEDGLVISEESCVCLKKNEADFFGATNYGKLTISRCEKDKYCYDSEEGCLKYEVVDLKLSRLSLNDVGSWFGFVRSLRVSIDLSPFVTSVRNVDFVLKKQSSLILVTRGGADIAIIDDEGFFWFNSMGIIDAKDRLTKIAEVEDAVEFNEVLSLTSSSDIVVRGINAGPVKLGFRYKSNLRIDYDDVRVLLE